MRNEMDITEVKSQIIQQLHRITLESATPEQAATISRITGLIGCILDELQDHKTGIASLKSVVNELHREEKEEKDVKETPGLPSFEAVKNQIIKDELEAIRSYLIAYDGNPIVLYCNIYPPDIKDIIMKELDSKGWSVTTRPYNPILSWWYFSTSGPTEVWTIIPKGKEKSS